MKNYKLPLLGMIFFLFLAILLPLRSNAATIEQHKYLKVIGEQQLDFDWQLMQQDNLKLVTLLGSEEDITRMNQKLETLSWAVNDPESKTSLLVVRSGDALVFSGFFKGEKIDRRVEIDSGPWYQALSMSLRQFNRSGAAKLKFWSIRPDTLDVHPLQVLKGSEEALQLHSQIYETIKLKIQLTGFRSVFWSCHYWMRKNDGLFVRYEGPSGPPGWPLTVVELRPDR